VKRLFRLIPALWEDVRAAFRLGGGRSFARLGSDLILGHFIGVINNRRLAACQDAPRKVLLRDGTTLFYRFNKGDLHAIRETWFRESYRLPSSYKSGCFQGATLVDLGANIGLTALWLARRYGFTRIIAVEPVADNARLVEKNARGNGIEAVVIEAAVAAHDGTVLFADSSSSTNGLVLAAVDGVSARKSGREVRAVGMATILESFPAGKPLDLVKIDIEGSEGELLDESAPLDWLARAQNLVIEFHPTRVDYKQLQQNLETQGMKQVRTARAHPRGDEIELLEFYARD
jgi:FkbM family methyltransferase